MKIFAIIVVALAVIFYALCVLGLLADISNTLDEIKRDMR